MRVPLRETGSILVKAPRDQVYEALRASMQREPSLRTDPDARLETPLSTFVLKDAPGGTRVIHARQQETTLASMGMTKPREALRAQVEMDLFELQRRFS